MGAGPGDKGVEAARGDVGEVRAPLLDIGEVIFNGGGLAILESGVPFNVLIFGDSGGDNKVESSTVVAKEGSQHSLLTYFMNSLVSSIDLAAPFST